MTAVASRMPKGVPYIIGNEAAERFSFYGMKAILVIFITKYLVNSSGNPEFNEPEAMVWYHNFSSAAYFFPIVGALLSDIFLGKYKTIINLSIVYCLGHLTLALFETKLGLGVGLALIAIGAGGIKPCVSAHVGDQFGEENKDLLPRVFSWFYFSINFGSFFSTLLTPILLVKYGPSVAFGIPGLLMLLATIVFWMGRHSYRIIPPAGVTHYKKELSSKDARVAMLNLCGLYLFVAFFWALYDQTGSSWVFQADRMDRMVDFGIWQGELLASQIQAVNPILVMAMVPLFDLLIYPLVGKFVKVTPLRRIAAGMFLASSAFGIIAIAENMIQSGQTPSIMWQVWAFVVITAAEVLVSITCLEFSYTQAPNNLKSLIMGLYFLSVTLGNQITAMVNRFIQDDAGNVVLAGDAYYWFFAKLMVGAAGLFVVYSLFYKGKTFVQGAAPEPT
jgi:POT family proton-dependent oligopeptide transporter